MSDKVTNKPESWGKLQSDMSTLWTTLTTNRPTAYGKVLSMNWWTKRPPSDDCKLSDTFQFFPHLTDQTSKSPQLNTPPYEDPTLVLMPGEEHLLRRVRCHKSEASSTTKLDTHNFAYLSSHPQLKDETRYVSGLQRAASNTIILQKLVSKLQKPAS